MYWTRESSSLNSAAWFHFQIALDRSEQSDHFFLADFSFPANARVRAHGRDGGFDQVLATHQEAGAFAVL